MNFITVFYIIFSIFLALVISYYFYFYRTSYSKNKVYKILFILRAFTFFLLALFFINPKINKKSYATEKPNLILAVDESSSIDFLKKSDSVKLVLNAIKSNKNLVNKFDIQSFGFGEKLSKLDMLAFNKKQTNIFKSLKQLNNIFNKNSVALLVTDGNQTIGNDYQYFKSKYPVYALAVGDTAVFEDLKIVQVNHNNYTFKGNRFPIEVFLQHIGNKEVNTIFTVFENGKSIYSKPIKFSANKDVQNLKFELVSKQSGIHQYTAILSPYKDEINLKNNKFYFSINTLVDKQNILLISNIKHPDIGALKRSIESNNQHKLTVIIGDGKQVNLKKYQLVIVYQPNNHQALLFKNIKENKIPFLTITGSQTDWNFLNTVQQVFHKDVNGLNQEYLPYINNAFEPFTINTLDFKDFPPLLSKFGTIKFTIKPRILLFSKVNNIKTKQALMATFSQNNRRGAVILGENIWKWRMAWFNKNKNFDGFDNFINNLVQYLSDYDVKKQIKVTYKPVIYANQPIEFKAQFFDDTRKFDNRGQLKIEINKENSNSKQTYPLILNGQQYDLTINSLNPGKYDFKIFESKRGLTSKGKFVILDFPIEQQFYKANFNKLQTLTSYNNGRTYLLKNYKDLITKLITNNQYKTIQKQIISSTNLLSFKWLFLLIIISATAEWFIRKYHGLI